MPASPLAPPEAELPEKDGYGKLTRVAVFTSPPFGELMFATAKGHGDRSFQTDCYSVRQGCRNTIPRQRSLDARRSAPSYRRTSRTDASIRTVRFTGGAVAQLGARLDGIEEVVGSNPIGSTKTPGYGPGTWVTQRT